MYAWLFKRLTDKEEIQVELTGIHAKLVLETFVRAATLKADVHRHWPATLQMIDSMIADKEAGREVLYT